MDTLNDLLAFEKIQSTIMELDITEENPYEYIIESLKPFYIQARVASIQLYCEKSYDIDEISYNNKYNKNIVIRIDTTKMNTVIRNFISNAIKFSKANSTIIVRLLLKDKFSKVRHTRSTTIHNNILRVEVIDTGAGISKENISKLFGYFVQVEAKRLQGGKGSGIGLWLSKQIVELHGGIVGVESTGEGNGSCFYFELPYETHNSNNNNENNNEIDNENDIVSENVRDRNTSFDISSHDTNTTFATTQPANDVLRPASVSQLNISNESNSKCSNYNSSNNNSRNNSIHNTPRQISQRSQTQLSQTTTPQHHYQVVAQRSLPKDILSNNPNSPESFTYLTQDGNIYDTPTHAYESLMKTPVKNQYQYNILCCDDVALIRRMVERTLQSESNQFDQASNGVEAIDLIKSHNNMLFYDIILLDAYMPIVSI